MEAATVRGTTAQKLIAGTAQNLKLKTRSAPRSASLGCEETCDTPRSMSPSLLRRAWILGSWHPQT